MMQNNNLLHILGKGSPIVLLNQNSLNNSKSRGGSHSSRLFPSLCSPDLELTTGNNFRDEFTIAKKQVKQETSFTNGKIQSSYNNDGISSHSENRLFSCVTCGILCFASVAIVQPTEIAASYLMSADCSVFSKLGVVGNDHNGINDVKAPITDTYSELVLKNTRDGLVDNPVAFDEVQILDDKTVGPSSLGLLAFAYGNSSDSEEDNGEADISNEACGPDSDSIDSETNSGNEVSRKKSNSSENIQTNNCTLVQSNSLTYSFRHQTKYRHITSNCTPMTYEPNLTISSGLENTNIPFTSRADEDSLRLHVFCLQHAIQVKKWLESLGGANVFLVCHPDYPKLESRARKIAQEMEINDLWNEISFREASEEDVETMRIALDSENGIHSNGDWAVKMGFNPFFSANLSRSLLYSKQMPYNFIVYSAFGRSSTMNDELEGKGLCRQRKLVVVGKWCGKVWMSNQSHPLLVNKDFEPSEGNETCKTRSKNAISRDSTLSNLYKRTRSKNGIKRVKKAKIHEAEKLDESSEELDSCTNRHRIKRLKKEIPEAENLDDSSQESPISNSRKQIKGKRRMENATTLEPRKIQNRSKKQTNLTAQDEPDGGPTTRLRKREAKHYKGSLPRLAKSKKGPTNGEYSCDMEACTMSFGSKHELTLHKRNICPVKGCGKKLFSHKYLVQHRRVHMDDRPLKCPWKGCKMTFKWAWARTEHIRVHTGARPYVCTEPGCGQTFRFVSDFSRHKRKTGHVSKKAKR